MSDNAGGRGFRQGASALISHLAATASMDRRISCVDVRRFNNRQTLTPFQYQFSDLGDFASLFGAQEAA